VAAIGQYELKIFFRIPTKDHPQLNKNSDIRDLYRIDWNVEINGKRLVDHTLDIEGNWNMKVNWRRLMDSEGDLKFEKISKDQKYPNLKYNEYWNVPLPELDPPKLEEYKNRIYEMMNEEDSKSEPLKLFRPIYLVNTL
jgi:hypothetical protein